MKTRITISLKRRSVIVNDTSLSVKLFGEPVNAYATWDIDGLLESWTSAQKFFTTYEKVRIMRAWISLHKTRTDRK